jgi:plastocyanin
MTRTLIRLASLAILLAAAPARAATVDIDISDQHGRPAANAVVALISQTGSPAAGSRLPAEAVIDQRNETFIPLVTILPKGGHVVFTNNDTTMHQVYSFSPIKQFEFEIDQGRRSAPVVFDKPGVAAIGCNIHDHMITYVYVADTPWTALTDPKGRAQISGVPSGSYRAEVWHPQLLPGRPAPSAALAVNGATKLALAVPLLAEAPEKHMHMGSY